MDRQSYWSHGLSRRLSRRRALAFTGGLATSAAFLAACGEDDGEPQTEGATSPATGTTSTTGSTGTAATGPTGSTGTASSGIVTTPADTTAQAKQGGKHVVPRNQDIVTFDSHFLSAGSIANAWVANRLVRQKLAVLERAPIEFEGDLAQSWEFSPDGLEVTLKVQPSAKFHDIAPVNGREVEAEDIVKSWERFVEVASVNANYATSVNPNAPILSVSAVDQKTVSIKAQ
jgi:ABC-type transport system substrate-binding protein